MKQEVHWVGGNLPKIGKSWTVRALLEVMQMRLYQPSLIDTSVEMAIGQVYAPQAHAKRTCDFDDFPYFTADKIFEIKGNPLVIKLASGSQEKFLTWAKFTEVFQNSAQKHILWFVTNWSRQSHLEFTGLQEGIDRLAPFGAVEIRVVDNIRLISEQQAKYPAFTQPLESCSKAISLSGVISPMESLYLDQISHSLLATISNLSSVELQGLSGITISRIHIFLRDCLKEFGGLIPEFSVPAPSAPKMPRSLPPIPPPPIAAPSNPETLRSIPPISPPSPPDKTPAPSSPPTPPPDLEMRQSHPTVFIPASPLISIAPELDDIDELLQF